VRGRPLDDPVEPVFGEWVLGVYSQLLELCGRAERFVGRAGGGLDLVGVLGVGSRVAEASNSGRGAMQRTRSSTSKRWVNPGMIWASSMPVPAAIRVR
jgi:hypothetical protein